MSSLGPSSTQVVCLADSIMEHLSDDYQTLSSCRLVSRSFYESSSRVAFRRTSILSTTQAFVDANLGGFLPAYVRELQLGHRRKRSHDRRALPSEIDTKQLAEICGILSSLDRIKLGNIILKPPYNLSSRSLVPGGFTQGHIILLRDVTGPRGEGSSTPKCPSRFCDLGLEVEEADIFVPSRGASASGYGFGDRVTRLEGGQVLHSQRLCIQEGCEEAMLHHASAEAVFAGGFWHSMAFYGGSIGTWRDFGRFLAQCGGGIKSLALSWTCLRVVHSCAKIPGALAPAITQCTSLESLTTSLLLGPGSFSTIDDQWCTNVALLRAANKATLCFDAAQGSRLGCNH